MTNFLQETLTVLASYNKTPEDVLWVGDHEKKTTWEDFASIANFSYDNGYGINEITDTLYIVGDNWWLERGEYDGSEWWEFKTTPTCDAKTYSKIVSVKYDWNNGIIWGEDYEKSNS